MKILFLTHAFNGLAQRLYVMNKGTIVFSGTPDELGSARDVEARYLGV